MKPKQTDSLGDRMKAYEAITRTFLIPKLHTILRLDGCHFHTYTKKFEKPFDDVLINAMDETAKHLCSSIQGAKFAFVQSDEITIYLSDRDNLETQMWYGGNVQKMVSVSAAKATAKFNHIMFLHDFVEGVKNYYFVDPEDGSVSKESKSTNLKEDIENKALAEFDSRVFQLPNEEEVVNNLLWRQQDTIRNSKSSVAQTNFSSKELHGVNTDMMVEKLAKEKGIDFYKDFSLKLQQGRFIDKITYVNDEQSVIFNKDPGSDITYYNFSKNILHSGHSFDLKTLLKTDKVRSKWESVECPKFNEQRDFIISRL